LGHAAARVRASRRTVYLHFRGKKRLRVKQTATMTERFQTDNRELDDLFERYRAAPGSHIFAPLADACRKAGMLDEALEICARGVGAPAMRRFMRQGKTFTMPDDREDAGVRALVSIPEPGGTQVPTCSRARERARVILRAHPRSDPDNREIPARRGRRDSPDRARRRRRCRSGMEENETLDVIVEALPMRPRCRFLDEENEVAVLPDMEDVRYRANRSAR
jgi:AcrR family transcriptional regulator